MSSDEKCCTSGATAGINVGGVLDVISPFVKSLLEQVVAYAIAHSDDIISAIMHLFDGAAISADLATAGDAFKAAPSKAGLQAVIAQAVKDGCDPSEISAVMLNLTNITLP